MDLSVIRCKGCHKFDFCRKYEQDNVGKVNSKGVWVDCMSPIRKCQYAIAEKHFENITSAKVLEVGCGGSRKGGFIKAAIERAGSTWIGIDIVQSDLTTHVADVVDMPFKDGEFDVVIGNQTMEHWDKPTDALREINRVLKTGGLVYLNVPIHLHGTEAFVRGDFGAIGKYFSKTGFDLVSAEQWRSDPTPLSTYLPIESKNHLAKFPTSPTPATAYIANFILRKIA